MAPTGLLVGAIESVRTRILDLALGIEAEDPRAGDPSSASIAPEQDTTIYNTVVHGGNVALGSKDFSQVLNSAPADLDDLLTRLATLGVPETLRDELTAALAEDGSITDDPSRERSELACESRRMGWQSDF